MRKVFVLFALACFTAAHAEETYLGLYLQKSKIGYAAYTSHPETLGAKKVTRSDSKTFMGAGLLGQAMTINIDSTTWTDSTGKPVKMLYVMSSGGRTQRLTAIFGPKQVQVDINNAGAKSHRILDIPKGGTIVDDPLVLVNSKTKVGASRTMWVLDPTTVAFMKNEVVARGAATTTINNKTFKGSLIEIIDPRATMRVYMNAKGGLLKVEGPLGIEMLPESRAVALSGSNKGYRPSADLAFATSIKTDKKIDDPSKLIGLDLRITGRDLSRIPSDSYQTVSKDGSAWLVRIHPAINTESKSHTVAEAQKGHEMWLKPTMHIPATSPRFVKLAKSITSGKTTVIESALAIKSYVQKSMQPNAGIGVLRDASEILSTKEGVCRDYAILTATLMRAAGIPARLASGLVNWEGDFYYHAWVEIWDGDRWVGIDSTVEQEQISAAHVKLADGNVEQAFAFTFLDKVKVEVLDVKRG